VLTATQFAAYAYLKDSTRAFIASRGVEDPDKYRIAISLWAGAASGATSQSVSYPLDTIRRRLQIQQAMDSPVAQYKNGRDAFVTILKYEGLSGLYRGAWINALRAGPSTAVRFAAYEFAHDLLLGLRS
jgi:Mitochondrial carrier protein